MHHSTILVASRHRGFTLTELVIAIALVAILAALAVPSFNDFRERTLVKGTAEQVLTQVGNARFEAVKRNRAVRVTVVRTSDTAWCIGASEGTAAACDCTVRDVTAVNYCELGYFPEQADGARGVRMTAVNGFDFNINPSMGTLDAMGAANNVTLRGPARNYQLFVTVSPLAQGRACIPAGSDAFTGYRAC